MLPALSDVLELEHLVLSQHATGLKLATVRGCVGASMSGAQKEMCQHLRKLAKSVVCLSFDEGGGGLRLPAAGARLHELREQLDAELNLPYARIGREFKSDPRSSDFSATKALPVVAERLSLPSKVSDFDCTPYLSDKFKEIYLYPDRFLKPPEEMPPPIRVKGTASRLELLKVFARWDALGRLYVCRASDVSSLDRCELFAVAKDRDRDRQILHRRRRNQREQHVEGASKDLPHGVLLTQLPMEDKHVCVCSVDDVKDFYHAYSATDERARSSPVGPTFYWREVAKFRASQQAKEVGRVDEHDVLVCCFKGLGMGDHAAVDIAQESHTNLLRAFGGMKKEETLNYRKPLPVPPSKYYEGVMIDDHLGVQLLQKRSTLKETVKQPGRDLQAFQSAEHAYNSTGLEAHPGKKVRRSCRVWGAEIEGVSGLVGPSRTRLLKLSQLTSVVAQSGPIDEKVLEALLGLWAYCAQFRRPMFSFMFHVYYQHSPGTSNTPFKLSKEARNEFFSLAMLSPCCISDITVLPDDHLFCVDASPDGAGVCKVKVGRSVVRELWRRGDKQGYRAPMLSRVQSYLKSIGIPEDDFDDEDVSVVDEENDDSGETKEQPPKWLEEYCDRVQSSWDDETPNTPQRPLFEHPFDLLEMYSGCGRMSTEWQRQGLKVLPPLELKEGWDLTSESLFWGLLSFIRAGKVKMVWWAPPCTTFSLARTPKLRSLLVAWGFRLLERKTLAGNLHASQSMLIAMVQISVGGFMGGEQPAFGFMRALECWQLLLVMFDGVFEILFDWCRYSQNFRKTTRVISNFPPFRKLGLRCNHSRKHVKLEGQATTKAGAYSSHFCKVVAGLWKAYWMEFDGTPKECREVFGEPPRVQKPEKGGSHLWAVQLSESLPWHTWIQYSFKSKEHINLQETKARRSFFKRLRGSKRVVIAQGSRVNLGSLGKGRSPSSALNRLMKSEAPLILGKNLYVAGIRFPTWSIRADCPSRKKAVFPPRTPVPKWFWNLQREDPEVACVLDGMEGLPRSLNR